MLPSPGGGRLLAAFPGGERAFTIDRSLETAAALRQKTPQQPKLE
ncbi:MAG TPA: hypothetical protein VFE22_04960 [Edaphobacter sp.]|nr:hypothetical protein [Edaphobacter sp.]